MHETQVKNTLFLRFCLLEVTVRLLNLSLYWQSLKCITFLASKIEHFGNYIHLCQDIWYTVTLNFLNWDISEYR